MKKLILISILPIVFGVCKTHKKEEKNYEKVFHLSEHFSKFKYREINEYNVDKDAQELNLIQLDSLSWQKIWQDSLSFSKFDRCYYYSTFKDSTIISLFQENEEWSANLIWLLKYDNFGKLKCKKLIGMKGSDAGDYWHLKSKLISHNNWIDTFYTSSQDLDTDELEEDSLITKFSLSQNFSIKTDTILKKNFSQKSNKIN